MRRLVQAIVVAVCLLLAAQVWADAQQQLDIAVTRYQNGRYEDAAEILSKLLGIPVDPSTPEGAARQRVNRRARPYHVAALHALGKVDEARAVALEHYRDDPFYEPPAGQFPPPVTELFIEVEAANREEIEGLQAKIMASKQNLAARRAKLEKARAERLRELEQMAAEQIEIIQRSRIIAAVPFGVGQYQNDDLALGLFFTISETLALASTLTAAGIGGDALVKLAGPRTDPNGVQVAREDLLERYRKAQLAGWISLGAFGTLAIVGIIEAQVSFEGTTVVKKKRPIPPPVVPEAIVTESGAVFGLSGHF